MTVVAEFKRECLAIDVAGSIRGIDAKIMIEEFRRQYNEVRPHSSLVQPTPGEFKQKLSTINPEMAVFQIS